jgi:hypothetical protein
MPSRYFQELGYVERIRHSFSSGMLKGSVIVRKWVYQSRLREASCDLFFGTSSLKPTISRINSIFC